MERGHLLTVGGLLSSERPAFAHVLSISVDAEEVDESGIFEQLAGTVLAERSGRDVRAAPREQRGATQFPGLADAFEPTARDCRDLPASGA